MSTKAGLVGFLLALSGLSPGPAAAAPEPAGNGADLSVDARLARITGAIRVREAANDIDLEDGLKGEVAAVFLNSAPSFRNYVSGWRNNYPYWVNTGHFYNTGAHFLNTVPSFRNTYGGWLNNAISGWRNGGSFANGGGFRNGGAFRNGGGFLNR